MLISNGLAEAELQTLFGERLFEKPQRLACQRALTCQRVRVDASVVMCGCECVGCGKFQMPADPVWREVESCGASHCLRNQVGHDKRAETPLLRCLHQWARPFNPVHMDTATFFGSAPGHK